MNEAPPKTKQTLRLAIYGKGGIGKSTIAANLSAVFGKRGLKVLQIGCDPKHDSTRLLLGHRNLKTVLEYLDNPTNQSNWMQIKRNAMSGQTVREAIREGRGLPQGLNVEEILQKGFSGIDCIEAGGPIPGIGCAGRGILTTFELIEKLGISTEDYDVVIYDVLGDVVCGGFGVPMREHHANAILLVTSEEYMPIYAANNILRGVEHFQQDGPRVLGYLLNRRNNQAPTDMLERFSELTEIPIISRIPRSELIQQAEHQMATLRRSHPGSEELQLFESLADELLSERLIRHQATSLDNSRLQQEVRWLGRTPKEQAPIANKHDSQEPVVREGGSGNAPFKLAVYGKGGIGKSTIAANLSGTLGKMGFRVLQIGCDPKHDSTNILTPERPPVNVLDYLRDVKPQDQKLDDLIQAGRYGVHCIEVGGPVPGMGCAGRGLLSAFTALEKLGLRDHEYDVIIYDVLGDVVCGGFAVPLRKNYADAVLLVSSEEYMPIYAANNILKGIANLSDATPKILGLFSNRRDNDGDDAGLERFCQSVRIPMVGQWPRSAMVESAEKASQLLVDHCPNGEETRAIARLAGCLFSRGEKHMARAIHEKALEEIVIHGREVKEDDFYKNESSLGRSKSVCPSRTAAADDEKGESFTRDYQFQFASFELPPSEPYYYRQKPIRPPIMNCAFHGAMLNAMMVRDAMTVVHAPRSCAHMRRVMMAGAAGKTIKRKREFYPDPLAPNLVSTDMDEAEMIYGGTQKLADTLKRVLVDKPEVVYLVTACPSAIIGDNIPQAIKEAQSISPTTRIIPLRSDGNMTGGGMNGMLSSLFDGLMGLAKKGLKTKPHAVNLLMNWDKNRTADIERLLRMLGLDINMSFSVGMHNAGVADYQKFTQAPLTLMEETGFIAPMLRKYMEEEFGIALAEHHFPRGFRETQDWLREIGRFFSLEKRVEEILAPQRERYEREMAEHRKTLKGKRAAMFWRGGPLDWLLDAAVDAGMDVVLVGVMARQEDIKLDSKHETSLPFEYSFHPDDRIKRLEELNVDAVIGPTRHDLPSRWRFLDTVGVRTIGFGSCVKLAKRWAALFSAPLSEGWRNDFPEANQVRTFAGLRRF